MKVTKNVMELNGIRQIARQDRPFATTRPSVRSRLAPPNFQSHLCCASATWFTPGCLLSAKGVAGIVFGTLPPPVGVSRRWTAG